VGTGLIGGSVGMALRKRGWHVTGRDAVAARARRAMEVGAIDAVGDDVDAEITFVAVPVLHIAGEVQRALATTGGIVTDVGSVKGELAGIADARYVPGHPMAGSEQDGVEGASADLFDSAVWVLTPTPATSDVALGQARAVVASLGADVVVMTPERHDALVAVVSHVPHLTAATLMTLASARAREEAPLLRLAAGGFRDMTRVAAGHPAIWPDICSANSTAIVGVLDELIERLRAVRAYVDQGLRAPLLDHLEAARAARRNLPSRAVRPAELVEVLVPVPDRKGEIARITMLAADLDVNVSDIEVSHTAEGDRGVLTLVVPAERAQDFVDALHETGYHPSLRPLA
jgi:prephenate dehydrogenase